MQKIFLLLMLLSCFSHLYAQKYNVSGKVSNTLGEDLSYVNITILNATDSTFVNGTTANDTGAFSLTQSAGDYIIRFSYLGYKTKYQDIHVVSQNIDMKNIEMEDDAIVLNEVVAKASRPTIKRNATGFLVSVENAKHLQNKTLDRILNVSPGIYVDKDGALTINGRGGVTVIVNDKTLRLSGEQLVSYLKSIQGSDLKNIEIMSNPTSSYDAEGTGGVVKINTKRKKDTGLSGYVSSNFSYNNEATYDEAVGVSYSIKNVTIYGNYSFSHLKSTAERYTTDIFDDGTKYDISENFTGHRTYHTYKFGVDWDISNKHYIGVEYNGQYSLKPDGGETTTKMYKDNIYNGKIIADIPSCYTPFNNLYNINYVWKIDTLGQQLKFLADYSDVKDLNSTAEYFNEYFDPADVLINTLNKRQISDEAIDIYSAQLDYETRFGTKKWKLSSGAKYCKVTTDYRNNILNWKNPEDTPLEDEKFKDHFKYDEERYALYANANYESKILDANAGLRAEYTHTKGISYVKNEINTDNDFRLFPSCFLYYKPNETHGFMAYYGMRIRRPDYQSVNPFIYYLTETSLKKGNPALKPAISNVVEFTYVIKNKYYLAINAQFENRTFNEYTYNDNGISIATIKNLDNRNQYYFSTYAPIDCGIWNSSNSFHIGMREYKNENKKLQSLMMGFDSRNYFRFTENLGAELNFSYAPPYRSFYTKSLRHHVQLDISMDYTFWKNRITLTVGVYDILNTRREMHSESSYVGFSEEVTFFRNDEGRTFIVGLKYNFNIGKNSKQKQREKSNSDEMNRL